MVKPAIISILILIISSCTLNKMFQDDELISLERINNDSNALKLDGYYVMEIGTHNPTYIVYFLYRNGIILYGGGATQSEFQELMELYKNGDFYLSVKNGKTWWGVYQIDDNEIKFERWYPSERPYETFLRVGEIVNDSTFRITVASDSDGSNPTDKDELYQFKSFSSKPDSTNVFIQ